MELIEPTYILKCIGKSDTKGKFIWVYYDSGE